MRVGIAHLIGLALSNKYDIPATVPFTVVRGIQYSANHMPSASKYKPHQGTKECARRIRQGLAR